MYSLHSRLKGQRATVRRSARRGRVFYSDAFFSRYVAGPARRINQPLHACWSAASSLAMHVHGGRREIAREGLGGRSKDYAIETASALALRNQPFGPLIPNGTGTRSRRFLLPVPALQLGSGKQVTGGFRRVIGFYRMVSSFEFKYNSNFQPNFIKFVHNSSKLVGFQKFGRLLGYGNTNNWMVIKSSGR